MKLHLISWLLIFFSPKLKFQKGKKERGRIKILDII